MIGDVKSGTAAKGASRNAKTGALCALLYVLNSILLQQFLLSNLASSIGSNYKSGLDESRITAT